MEYRQLAEHGPKVSVLGFGGAAISGDGGGYGFGAMSETQGVALVDYVFERGINLFDTAPIYGFGQSERTLGKALRGEKRHQSIVVSKGGITWHSNKRVNLSNEPEVIETMLHQSLRDLKTDYLDVYMIHWPDPRVDIRLPMEVLNRAKDQGKIKLIGLCNSNDEDLQKAQEIATVDVLQSEYNLLNTERGQWMKIHSPQKGMMAWGTFDKGLLTGSVHPDRKYSEGDARKNAPWWKSDEVTAKWERVQRLLNEKPQTVLGALALAGVLVDGKLSCALVGGKSSDQWDGIFSWFENRPSAQEVKDALEILGS